MISPALSSQNRWPVQHQLTMAPTSGPLSGLPPGPITKVSLFPSSPEQSGISMATAVTRESTEASTQILKARPESQRGSPKKAEELKLPLFLPPRLLLLSSCRKQMKLFLYGNTVSFYPMVLQNKNALRNDYGNPNAGIFGERVCSPPQYPEN